MTKKTTYNKALSYAHRLFNYRPRSKKELKERLLQRGYNTAIVNRVTALFKQQGLIDDKNFAKLWASSRMQAKPSSLTSIKQQLFIKGIDSQIIDDTLEQLREDFDEYEVAKNLAEKRIRLYAGVGKLKKKKRLFDYLRRRGFSFDVIYKVLDGIIIEAKPQ